MNDTQHPGNTEASAIEAAFGGRWRVWLSDTGSWWAARSEPPTAAERAAGCVHYLRADTPGELRQFIEEQEHLRGRRPPARPPPQPSRHRHPYRRTSMTDSPHDTPSPASSQEALECLAAALDPGEFVTSLTSGYGRRPFLTVTSRHAAIGGNIYADGCAYTWSWAEKIAATSHPRAAAAEISRVLGIP